MNRTWTNYKKPFCDFIIHNIYIYIERERERERRERERENDHDTCEDVLGIRCPHFIQLIVFVSVFVSL